MSLYAVFKIEIQDQKQSYDLLGIFSDIDLAKTYVKRRLKEKVDRHFKRDPILTKENYFTIVAKRGSFVTRCPGYCVELIQLDKHYR